VGVVLAEDQQVELEDQVVVGEDFEEEGLLILAGELLEGIGPQLLPLGDGFAELVDRCDEEVLHFVVGVDELRFAVFELLAFCTFGWLFRLEGVVGEGGGDGHFGFL
jgi:hypothetical protein